MVGPVEILGKHMSARASTRNETSVRNDEILGIILGFSSFCLRFRLFRLSCLLLCPPFLPCLLVMRMLMPLSVIILMTLPKKLSLAIPRRERVFASTVSNGVLARLHRILLSVHEKLV